MSRSSEVRELPASSLDISLEERERHLRRFEAFLDPRPRPGCVRIYSQAARAPFLLLVTMVFMAFALNFTNDRMPDPKRWKQLPDVAFDVLPPRLELEHVTDLLLWIINGINVITALCLYVQHKRVEQRTRKLISESATKEELLTFSRWPADPSATPPKFDETTFHGKVWSRLAPLLMLVMDDNAKFIGNRDIVTDIDEIGDNPTENSGSDDKISTESLALDAEVSNAWKSLVPRHARGIRVTLLNAYLICWIRYWCAFAVMSITRSFVIVATVLPATNNHCQDPRPIPNRWFNAFLAVVTFGSGSIHCGDLLFSGHMSTIFTAFVSIWSYSRYVNWTFRYICTVCLVLSWYTILSSRSHYTDDIAIAMYCGLFTYMSIPHDTRRGAPSWIQMFLSVLQIPACCRPSATETSESQLTSGANGTAPVNGVVVVDYGGDAAPGVPNTKGTKERLEELTDK